MRISVTDQNMAQLRGSLLPADSAEPAKRKVRQRTVQIGEDGSRLFRTQEKIKVGADPEGFVEIPDPFKQRPPD